MQEILLEKRKARIRNIIMVTHTKEMLDAAIDAYATIGQRMQII